MRRLSDIVLVSGMLLVVPAFAGANDAPSDSSLGLRAKEEVTDLRRLRIEADNQVQIRFERPALHIDLDPEHAPGLQWGSVLDVLDRTETDLVRPLLATTAGEANPYLARPWLDGFQTDTVARFRPAVDGAASWSLVIADSRGKSVRTFAGSGKPPAEIAWDGRADDETFAPVGPVYSYVLTAADRAGNKRNFVGDAFELPPYRTNSEESPHFLFTGAHLTDATSTPLLLVEIASRVNRSPEIDRAVNVHVAARTQTEADALAARISAWLEPRIVDGSRRLMTTTEVASDAPVAGGVQVAFR